MKKIIKNKLSKQGRRIYGIATKKAKAYNLTFKNRMFGITANLQGKYELNKRHNNCCCIIGACMLNKPAETLSIESITDQAAKLYGETSIYYIGLMDGFDNEIVTHRKEEDYLVGVHDGTIMKERLGLQ